MEKRYLNTMGGLFGDCSLVLEPENEYDSEAIAVHIGSTRVGYVPKKGFEDGKKYIHGVMSSGETPHLGVSLVGGKYKFVNDDDEIETGELSYGLRGQISIRTEKVNE